MSSAPDEADEPPPGRRFDPRRVDWRRVDLARLAPPPISWAELADRHPALGRVAQRWRQWVTLPIARLPIRVRLAGASAALTLVILCIFAVAIGTLTARRIRADFTSQLTAAADNIGNNLNIGVNGIGRYEVVQPQLDAVAAPDHAVVRIIGQYNGLLLGDTLRRPRPRPAPQRPGRRRRLPRRHPGGHHGDRRRLRPVRPAGVRPRQDDRPPPGLPDLRRPRRDRPRLRRRIDDRPPGDGPDRRADRRGRRGRADPRPEPRRPRLPVRGRGRRARPDARGDAPRPLERPRRDRGDARPPARLRRRRLARAAHPADQRAGQPRAAQRDPPRRGGHRRPLGPALLPAHAPPGRGPPPPRPGRRQP